MNKSVFIISKFVLFVLLMSLVACAQTPVDGGKNKPLVPPGITAKVAKVSDKLDSAGNVKPHAFANGGYTRVDWGVTSPKKVGTGAFEGNKIKEITLPDSVTEVEENAFKGNPLTKITLNPQSTLSMKTGAFATSAAKLTVYVKNNKALQSSTTAADIANIFGKKPASQLEFNADASDSGTQSTVNTLNQKAAETENLHEVSLVVGGAPYAKEYTDGSSSYTPSVTPTKTGYKFKDNTWYTDASLTSTFAPKQISTDTTLYGAWTQKKFKVYFEPNKGEYSGANAQNASDINTQEIIYQQKATKPAHDPTRQGYTFRGWFEMEEKVWLNGVGYGYRLKSDPFDFDNTPIIQDVHLVASWKDTTAPTISAVAITNKLKTAQSKIYKLGETIEITVTFDEAVNVNPVTAQGLPRIKLTIGLKTVFADYKRGSNSKKLVFAYTVKQGDKGSITIGTNSLELNGGIIKDMSGGNDAKLSHGIPNLQVQYTVDGTQKSP